jgi:hypothetical protein
MESLPVPQPEYQDCLPLYLGVNQCLSEHKALDSLSVLEKCEVR